MRAIQHKLLFQIIKPATIIRLVKSVRVPASSIRNIMSESDQAPAFDSPRLVVKKVQAKLQQEGSGAVVRRGIGRFSCMSLVFYKFVF